MVGMLLLGMSCAGPSAERSSSAEAGDPSRVYHVQLEMTEDKTAANRSLGTALSWWRAYADSAGGQPLLLNDAERSVQIEWKAPYYRVRVGPFALRPQADSVLRAARTSFPDAFVVPERTN